MKTEYSQNTDRHHWGEVGEGTAKVGGWGVVVAEEGGKSAVH